MVVPRFTTRGMGVKYALVYKQMEKNLQGCQLRTSDFKVIHMTAGSGVFVIRLRQNKYRKVPKFSDAKTFSVIYL